MEAPHGEDGGIGYGIGLVFAYIFASTGANIFNEQANFYQNLLGDKAYAALIALIYNKTLKVSPSTNKQFGQGEIINFIQVDAMKAAEVAWCFPPVARLPIQLMFSLAFLFYYFGVYLFAAFGIAFVMIVLNFFIAIWNSKLQDKVLERKDKRMNTTTEVVNNIKIIKLNSWVKYFIDKVGVERNKELSTIKKSLLVNSLEIITAFLMSPFFMITTFGVFMLCGNSMSTATGFAALQVLFAIDEPIRWIPQFIGTFMEFLVSMRRIQRFLLCDEINSQLVESNNINLKNKDIDVLIEEANFSWAGKKEKTDDEKEEDKQNKKDREMKDRTSNQGKERLLKSYSFLIFSNYWLLLSNKNRVIFVV
jgi:ABC-type bacteriocin/lantibiotic exporter with double-glycine peptidase domain